MTHEDETSGADRSRATLNLMVRREARSVWDRRGWNGRAEIPALARILVAIGGGVLTVQGMKRRGLAGSLLVSLGTALGWWALTGRSPVPNGARWTPGAEARWPAEDPVLEASAASFPASDAPARTPATGTGLRRTTDVR